MSAMRGLEDLMRAMEALGPGYELHIAREEFEQENGESKETLYSVCLYEPAPEGGWANQGQRFGYAPEFVPGHNPVAEEERFEMRPIVSITAEDATAAARLTLNMVLAEAERGRHARLTRKS